MATTWIKAIHRGGGIASTFADRTGYVKDVEKTDGGELVDSYECQPITAQSEFLFSKRLYEQKTGRDQGKNDVIAYHVRMSFKPGEVTAEKALELGYELALRWTKGRHQFLVAAHTNTNNPHVHIIYNSVNLDCDGKFQDFKRSAIALRKVSDRVCLEHGLSVIENPGLSKGYNRAEYLGESKPPAVRERLTDLIDSIIPGCNDFNAFLAALQTQGVTIKRGKQLSFKLPDAKRFVRQDTLGDDYSPEAILERISGKRVVPPKRKAAAPLSPKPNLLIDIQAKLQQGYGDGFAHWARLVNLKEATKTLIFLQERGLADYDLLTQRIDAASGGYNSSSGRIKQIESRQKEIAEFQKHIGAYGKTKDILAKYNMLKSMKPPLLSGIMKTATPAEKFYEENQSAIMMCRDVKKYFDCNGYGKNKKLPTINSLKQEYAILDAEKRKLYSGYKAAREEMIALQMAKQNVDIILGEPRHTEKSRRHEASR